MTKDDVKEFVLPATERNCVDMQCSVDRTFDDLMQLVSSPRRRPRGALDSTVLVLPVPYHPGESRVRAKESLFLDREEISTRF